MKKILIVIAIIAALVIPVTAFAASSNSPVAAEIRGFCGIGVQNSNLTEQQKSDLSEAFNKMIELRKETIKKMVEDGSITKEQGDQQLKWIENMVQYHNENGYGFGPGMMDPGFKGRGRGMMNWYNN